MLVTPLRDGMNLVCKEYLACHDGAGGTLVLSEMAGASYELHEALTVNPFDQEGVVDAMRRALEMPEAEQRRRNAPMQERLARLHVREVGAGVPGRGGRCEAPPGGAERASAGAHVGGSAAGGVPRGAAAGASARLRRHAHAVLRRPGPRGPRCAAARAAASSWAQARAPTWPWCRAATAPRWNRGWRFAGGPGSRARHLVPRTRRAHVGCSRSR